MKCTRPFVQFLLICLALTITCACGTSRLSFRFIPSAESTARPYTAVPRADDAETFRFAILADRTSGKRTGVFESAVERVNWLHPDFAMSIGDFIGGYTTDTLKIASQWNEFEHIISKLDVPFFHVPGNHDTTYPIMVEQWRKRFGSPFYAFTYRDVLFLCLYSHDNCIGDECGIGPEQVAFARNVLASHRDVRWTFVFLHHPLFLKEEAEHATEYRAVLDALQGRPYTVFAGHYHEYSKSQVGGANCYVLATTGGFSEMKGPAEGQFDHIAWVTMTPKGPVIANLMLDGIYPDDVRGEAAKRKAANEAAAK
jgi:hypothetical protein